MMISKLFFLSASRASRLDWLICLSGDNSVSSRSITAILSISENFMPKSRFFQWKFLIAVITCSYGHARTSFIRAPRTAVAFRQHRPAIAPEPTGATKANPPRGGRLGLFSFRKRETRHQADQRGRAVFGGSQTDCQRL